MSTKLALYGKILAATDKALYHAIELAKAFKSQLVIVYVVPPILPYAEVPVKIP